MDSYSDLRFFQQLMQSGSLAATAQELGLSPPAISRRLALLEKRLGVRLLHRTTRRMHLTPEGETYLLEGQRLLAALDALEREVAGARGIPRGMLRIGATLGFGRKRLAPALSAFALRYPDIEVQLHLTDRPIHLVEQGFDAMVSVGEPPDSRLTARRLLPNGRVLCAAPSYLKRAGMPRSPDELATHSCIVLREGDERYGSWRLRRDDQEQTVKVAGSMSTNDGETALLWALNGHGIVQRSTWDVQQLLEEGALLRVLPEWQLPDADVYLVHAIRSDLSARIRVLQDFLLRWFARKA